jgi:hypothetical protein
VLRLALEIRTQYIVGRTQRSLHIRYTEHLATGILCHSTFGSLVQAQNSAADLEVEGEVVAELADILAVEPCTWVIAQPSWAVAGAASSSAGDRQATVPFALVVASSATEATSGPGLARQGLPVLLELVPDLLDLWCMWQRREFDQLHHL